VQYSAVRASYCDPDKVRSDCRTLQAEGYTRGTCFRHFQALQATSNDGCSLHDDRASPCVPVNCTQESLSPAFLGPSPASTGGRACARRRTRPGAAAGRRRALSQWLLPGFRPAAPKCAPSPGYAPIQQLKRSPREAATVGTVAQYRPNSTSVQFLAWNCCAAAATCRARATPLARTLQHSLRTTAGASDC